MKKGIILIILSCLLITGCSKSNDESPATIKYYMTNINLPVEMDAVKKKLGTPIVDDNAPGELNYKGLRLEYNDNGELRRIKVTSRDWDPLKKGVKVGDNMSKFREAYPEINRQTDTVGIFDGEYAPVENDKGICIYTEVEPIPDGINYIQAPDQPITSIIIDVIQYK